MSNTGLWDANGRFVTAQSTPTINLTTDTIEATLLLDNTALGASGAFDIDLSSGDALNCKHLVIECLLRSTVSAVTDLITVFFNNDTTSTNYTRQSLTGVGATPVAVRANNSIVTNVTASTADINAFGKVTINIPDFRGTSKEKIARVAFDYYGNSTSTESGSTALHWNNNSAVILT